MFQKTFRCWGWMVMARLSTRFVSCFAVQASNGYARCAPTQQQCVKNRKDILFMIHPYPLVNLGTMLS